MNRKLLSAFAACALLSACGANSGGFSVGLPAPKTPAQTLYETEASYWIALRVAKEYVGLSPCVAPVSPLTSFPVPPPPPLCADAATVKILQQTDSGAWAAIQTAEAAVRLKADPTAAVAAAQRAVQALTNLSAQLKVN